MRHRIAMLVVLVSLLPACSPIRDCENSQEGVRYVVTGKGVETASFTLSSDTEGMELGELELPYCRQMTGFEQGDQLYISVHNDAGTGSVTCKIYDGEELVSQSTANVTTTCSAKK